LKCSIHSSKKQSLPRLLTLQESVGKISPLARPRARKSWKSTLEKTMKKFAWAMLVLSTVSLMLIALASSASAQSKPVATPSSCVAAPPPAAAGAAAGAAAPAPAAAPTGRKKRVAIFDFDYATVQSSTSALFGTNVDVGKGISDLLVKCLVQDG